MLDHDIAITSIRDGAIELLERGWIQGNSAHDEEGKVVNPDSSVACAWCLTGAVSNIIINLGVPATEGDLYDGFIRTWLEANEPYVAEVMEEYDKDDQEATAILFNDKNCMTQEQVVASLKRIQPTKEDL